MMEGAKALMGNPGVRYISEEEAAKTVPAKPEKRYLPFDQRVGDNPFAEEDEVLEFMVEGPIKLVNQPQGQTIVLLNGPPGVGKDTLGEELNKKHDSVQLCSFKRPMFDIALAASGIPKDVWDARYNDRELKEEPWDRLNGLSCREFMIYISEEFIKPVFGEDHFGNMALGQVEGNGYFIFTDSGFQEEFRAVLQEFGKRNVKLVRLFKDGSSFEGDSRSYVQPEGADFMDIPLQEGEIEQGVSELEKFIGIN